MSVGYGRLVVMARAVLLGAALAAATVLAGCSADAQIDVVDSAPALSTTPAGTVTVTVTLDASAVALVGGLSGQLDAAGLAREGWQVGAPITLPGGGARVAATHTWSGQAQLTTVLDEVGGPPGAPLVAVRLGGSRGLFRRRVVADGTIDLSCGVGCFGDSGLAAVTGSVVGAAPAEVAPGVDPASSVRVGLRVELPGRAGGEVGAPAAAPKHAAAVTALAPLGGHADLALTTTGADHGAEVAAAIGGGLLVVVVAGAAFAVAWRVRRRRPRVHQVDTPPL